MLTLSNEYKGMRDVYIRQVISARHYNGNNFMAFEYIQTEFSRLTWDEQCDLYNMYGCIIHICQLENSWKQLSDIHKEIMNAKSTYSGR